MRDCRAADTDRLQQIMLGYVVIDSHPPRENGLHGSPRGEPGAPDVVVGLQEDGRPTWLEYRLGSLRRAVDLLIGVQQIE